MVSGDHDSAARIRKERMNLTVTDIRPDPLELSQQENRKEVCAALCRIFGKCAGPDASGGKP